jgi:hypothetical protein
MYSSIVGDHIKSSVRGIECEDVDWIVTMWTELLGCGVDCEEWTELWGWGLNYEDVDCIKLLNNKFRPFVNKEMNFRAL